MTPEDKKLLEAHIKEIAKILYKNTPPEKIETFEGIEISVRDQVLEHVSPKIGYALLKKESPLTGRSIKQGGCRVYITEHFFKTISL